MAVSLFFDIFGRDKGVGKMLDDVGGKAETFGSKMAGGMKAAAAPAAGVLAGLAGLAGQFGSMAATAEQSTGAVETVFGSAASKVLDFAGKSANAVGLSAASYNELSAVTGTALKAAGVSVDQLAGKNDALITRGADLASVFGGTTKEAVEAMGSAFRGEMDPLERYGVTLTMTQVNAELAARGQDKLGGAAAEAAKKQAIMDLVMQQSAGSAGNFAREADTASGAQERQSAAFADAGAKLGEVLLPAMTAAANAAAGMAAWAKENSGLLMGLGAVLGSLAGLVLIVNGAMAAHTAISAVVKGATAAWTAVQGGLNAALLANPIGIVVAAIALLIGSVVLAYQNVGWFKDGVDAAWSGIKGAIGGVVDWFTKTLVPNFSKGLDRIKGFFSDSVSNIGRIWNGLKETAAKPIRWVIQTVINDGIVKGFNGFSSGLFGKDGPRLSPINIGFADGGYTGDGAKHEPKGVVHGGEFVFTKEETQRAGVATLQRLSRVLRGFAEGGFVNPVDGGGTITQPYHAGHNGIDIAAPLNTKIMAAFDGNVTSAGWSPHGGGNEVHIKHAGGWETWYAHLNRILVKAGQVVNRAMTIGLMGSTGNSTGSHVHYMLMKGGWPNHVDPSPFMSGKVNAISINPLAALFDTLMGGFNGAGLMGQIAGQLGKKIMGSAGDFLMGGGTGSTRGGFALAPKVFDQGGWLEDMGRPQVVDHRRPKPDAVLPYEQWERVVAHAGQRLTVYVQNPWTGEYHAAKMEAIADGAIRSANDDLSRGRSRWL